MGVRAMGRVVLLTGATGFVGTEIAVRLLDRDDVTLVCLVQAATDDAALREARRAWYGRGQLPDAIGGRLTDRESFRAMANRVKERTGMKGKALFHPIRVALTGEGGGPELDLAVPAIERGAAVPSSAGVAPILGCRERAVAFAEAVKGR